MYTFLESWETWLVLKALLQSKPMGSPCNPHMFPIRSPYVRHMGKISKTTKSYVAHMLSNIWGNLWATQQHMGNIWGYVVIFAFKLALLNIWGTYGKHMGNIWGTYGKHMGNIWGTYGKHMGNIWETYGEHTQSNTQQNLSLPLLMQHPQGQSGFHRVCFESLFIINKDGRMNSGSTARADEILTWQQASVLPSAFTWCCKREVAVSFFASCAMTKRRRCMKNYKVKPTASRPWGDRSPAKQTSKRD